MKRFDLLFSVVLGCLLFSAISLGAQKRVELEKIFDHDETKDSFFYTTLGYQYLGSTIDHSETSSVEGYSSLGAITTINQNSLNLSMNWELLSKQYVSFTLLSKFGVLQGKAKESDTDVSYTDKAKGKIYGGGLSINLNTTGLGLLIQPYVSTQYLITDTEYELSYSKSAVPVQTYGIRYNQKETELVHSTGLRFFNSKQSLMSYVSADYHQPMEQKVTAVGVQGEEDLNISNVSKVERKPIGVSFGIGFLF